MTIANGRPGKLDLNAFKGRFRGPLLGPGDGAYDDVRKVWNGSIDRRPALIARCTGVADVIEAVRYARDSDLLVAVRSGGHSFPGLSVCDDGMVIDLGLMKGIRVDPAARTARVQAGVLLAELDREAQAFGLVVPSGIVSHTGVAGLTLGGGIGWLMRKYGLSIDQLRSVDLITAGGKLVQASASQNPELFWGLRGGGGNFGIVTEFEFRLNPVGLNVLGGPIFWPMQYGPELLRFYADWIKEAPDDLMTIAVCRRAPALPMLPSDLHGQPIVVVACCYAGPVEEGEAVLRPLRSFAEPAADLIAPKPFVDHQKMFDPAFAHGQWYYLRSGDVGDLADGIIDACIDQATRISSPLSTISIWRLGGAVARLRDDDTAFTGRAAAHTINVTGITSAGAGFEAERDWVRKTWARLNPHFTSVYVNHLMDEGEERIRQAYGPAKYDRLRALKRRYDPDNFFRANQNIRP